MRQTSTEWVSTLRAFVDDPGSIAIAGEDAGEVARELGLDFGLALTAEEVGFALLGADYPDAGRIRDLPDASIDIAVLRRPWNGPVEIGQAMKAAYRVLRPGGRVFAGERELDRLTRSSVMAYPLRAFVDIDPDVLAADLESSVGKIALAAGIVRAGFKSGVTLEVDEHRGTYETPRAFVGAFVDDLDDQGAVIDLLGRTHRRRSIADVDPWVYATALRP